MFCRRDMAATTYFLTKHKGNGWAPRRVFAQISFSHRYPMCFDSELFGFFINWFFNRYAVYLFIGRPKPEFEEREYVSHFKVVKKKGGFVDFVTTKYFHQYAGAYSATDVPVAYERFFMKMYGKMFKDSDVRDIINSTESLFCALGKTYCLRVGDIKYYYLMPVHRLVKFLFGAG